MVKRAVKDKWMHRGYRLRKGVAWVWDHWFEIVLFGILIAVPVCIAVSVITE